jgi:hypothetical protein
VAAECRSPWAVISPTPSALHAERSRRLKARFENGAPEYPANTNCDPAKAIPPGARMRRPLKPSWRAFHSRSDRPRRPGTGTSWKTLPLPLIRSATMSSPTLWQSAQVSWISSSNRQAVWKRAWPGGTRGPSHSPAAGSASTPAVGGCRRGGDNGRKRLLERNTRAQGSRISGAALGDKYGIRRRHAPPATARQRLYPSLFLEIYPRLKSWKAT